MSKLLITIGLDEHLVARIREAVDARVVSYPDVPKACAMDGQVQVESHRVVGRWLEPDGVIYYSYFEGVENTRRAIAVANTPSFPDMRTAIQHDDRVLSLLLATRAHSPGHFPRRGYALPGQELAWLSPQPHVFNE